MPRKKSIAILPRLCDVGGDVDKKWFIEYSMRNPRDGVMKRFRNYSIFTGISSADERYIIAEKYINELTSKIKSGWSVFDEQQESVIYEDELVYNAVAANYGRARKSNHTVNSYLSDFLLLKKGVVNKKTYQTYQSKMRSFCAYLELNCIAKHDISAINNEIITKFLLFKFEKEKLAKISIAKYQQILYSFFEYLINNKKVIKSNPVHDIPRIGEVKDCAPYPIPANIRKKLAKEIKHRDKQLWLACCMMYYSALRPGEEIRNLRVGDINFSSRKILVKSDTAKGNRTDTIDMPEQLHKELIAQRIDLEDCELYIFGKFGRPGIEVLGKNTMRNRFNKIRDDLNISSNYKFYSWKHSGAEALADHGATTWELQAHLRHRSVETTERYARKRIGNRNANIKNNFPDI
ncbi:MAG: Site-specific recombinase XerD [Bacteroidetes bacterium]|nr:Site-specific recombinase XerD [Bacteroidota bacterium]